jgi:hypothetical protein
MPAPKIGVSISWGYFSYSSFLIVVFDCRERIEGCLGLLCRKRTFGRVYFIDAQEECLRSALG